MQTFIEESNDLLQEMEDALLCIAPDSGSIVDEETINAIFRAAHTIKGSAGLFGLDSIVAFTHVVESVLDRARDGEVTLDSELVSLFLECRDHIGDLIGAIADGEVAQDISDERGAGLQQSLKRYLDEVEVEVVGENAISQFSVEHEGSQEANGGTEVETDNWHISLRFSHDVFRDGMDPLSFIRYLGTLGKIVYIVTLSDALPEVDDFDPETCYLGFEISFSSVVGKAEIEGVFEFVRDDCRLRILPPHSCIDQYIELIESLPEEEMRIGEILTRCGSLTENELRQALAAQAATDPSSAQPLGAVLVNEQIVEPSVVDAALKKQQKTKERRGAENSLIRVDAAKLDQLIDLIGELIIAGAGVGLIAQKANLEELIEVAATMSRLVEDVRDSALNLRMVQIGATFNRFNRVVRDVSKELGKEIRLEISGAETELDKTVVEQIGDPLTHLVRNSMDHGIEASDIRMARGKPEYGTLRLNAFHDSGNIVIEVSDDGGGLDKERIKAKAVERGLISHEADINDQEIYRLILEAGFSTADAVSNLSGRGVGMDVVRRNIEALSGSIEIESKQEIGTTIRIRLPLTLAIIDGFMVGVGAANYVIPQDMVVQCIELGATEVQGADSGYLNLRGEVLPFVRLRQMFGIRGMPPQRQNVVVVKHASQSAGLVVDQLHGEFQTVIKPLGKLFGKVPGVGGFTILGSGEVALILDVQRLVQRVQQTAGCEHKLAATG
ncbi:MAG: chemotaxis protein CheA [Candidatus Thiodiazotropha sp.]